MATSRDFKHNPCTTFTAIDKLSKKEAEHEIRALRQGIAYHNDLYYVQNQPTISDATYDTLFRRLQALEEAFPAFHSETSPTRRVGVEPVESLQRVEHKAAMLSLQATLEAEDVKHFAKGVAQTSKEEMPTFVLEPKYDGVSVEIVYEKGTFQYGATRGDGQTGEDISANLQTIGALPMHLQQRHEAPAELALRGEVFLRKEAFQKLNTQRLEAGEAPFANPRNAAAGLLRRLDSQEVARWPLDIVFYEILTMKGKAFATHWEALRQCARWGLKTSQHNQRCSSFTHIEKYRHQLAEQREELAYDLDGVVIKVDSLTLRSALGTRHRSPRWALAWKFPPKDEITRLEAIVVQVGRTGMLTPVALLQPVDVGGVTVSRATLHNEADVHRKDVRPGDTVRLVRAGDVIPEILAPIAEPGHRRDNTFSMPRTCPSCGAQVIKEGSQVFCPAGLSCAAQLVARLTHYTSRDALDIAGLGERTVKQLIDKGLVKNLAHLYELSVQELLQLEGFAEKSAQKLRDAIQETKHPRLDRFLYALGIRHVGQRTAREFARAFGSFDRLRQASEKELKETADVGAVAAARVRQFFEDEDNKKVLQRLEKNGVKAQNMPRPKTHGPLQGKTFVFTGELEAFTRDEAKEQVELRGARATANVSGNTDYVVVGTGPGRKLAEARRKDVEILDEKGFKTLLSS